MSALCVPVPLWLRFRSSHYAGTYDEEGVWLVRTLVAFQTIIDQCSDLDALLARPHMKYVSAFKGSPSKPARRGCLWSAQDYLENSQRVPRAIHKPFLF